MDSGFCVLQALIKLATFGVYWSAVMKKRQYWPKYIDGGAIDSHEMRDSRLFSHDVNVIFDWDRLTHVTWVIFNPIMCCWAHLAFSLLLGRFAPKPDQSWWWAWNNFSSYAAGTFQWCHQPDVPMSSPFILWCKEWWHLQPSITSGTNWKVYCLIFRKQHASVLWRSIGCSMAGPVNWMRSKEASCKSTGLFFKNIIESLWFL